ncbi:hypothetical protein NEOLEDRAFT_781622 [Neolentinus lepideus HHB14362 ss-1]|uniref:Uncharacterized protein n=1 Tax=Neolentinus lepideus HHB14362 ss-1 TaxID=1314782 RepID=A0A165UWR5_9AGAM|nr:hypothetical protein NEOLEDRAFT_781622 [Neolentinus lepideus HHB14362 ss-1]
MDRCPVEIVSEIISLACTDGGATGCSLSLVSKGMALTSEPFRFQSVALSGLRQISKFLEMSEGGPGRKIRHLFLCDRKAQEAYEAFGYGHLGLPKPDGSRLPSREWEKQYISDHKAASLFNALVLPLLQSAADVLETLSIIMFNPRQDHVFSKVLCAATFPVLADFSLRQPYTGGIPFTSASMQGYLPETCIKMPRLERLNVVLGTSLLSTNPHETNWCRFPWAGIAMALCSSASLKSIRISEMPDFDRNDRMAQVMVYFLRLGDVYLPATYPSDQFLRLPCAGPSRRRRIAIQPVLPVGGNAHNRLDKIRGQLDYLVAIDRFHTQKQTGDDGDLTLFALDPAPRAKYEDWMAEWLARQAVESHIAREDILFRNMRLV